MNSNTPRTSKQLALYRRLLEEFGADAHTFNQAIEQDLRFVTFRTRSGHVVDIVVRASGKKRARETAQQIVDSGELCAGLKYVEVS